MSWWEQCINIHYETIVRCKQCLARPLVVPSQVQLILLHLGKSKYMTVAHAGRICWLTPTGQLFIAKFAINTQGAFAKLHFCVRMKMVNSCTNPSMSTICLSCWLSWCLGLLVSGTWQHETSPWLKVMSRPICSVNIYWQERTIQPKTIPTFSAGSFLMQLCLMNGSWAC